MNRESHRGLAALWPWLAGFTPALALLFIMLPLRGRVPFLDSWRFVGQYHDWLEGQYTWADLLIRHCAHPSAVGKIIYFSVLHRLHGEVSLLPLLSWGFAVVIALCIGLLMRPLWSGQPARGAMLMFCANLAIFTTAQAEAWIWDFLFQNFIPGVCLTLGMLILHTGRLTPVRITSVAALSLVAAFSFGSGFLVGFLFSILIWDCLRNTTATRRWLYLGAWVAYAGVLAWVALFASHAEGKQGAGFLSPDRIEMRMQFLLALLGRLLGEGTAFEPENLAALMGGALVAVFLVCVAYLVRHRRDHELISNSLRWIACSLYGLGNALLICVGRMNKSLGPALADRYASLTLFFATGTLILAATVIWHADAAGRLPASIRKTVSPALTLYIGIQLINWQQGYQTMNIWHTRMEQERAMLAFSRILPPGPDWMRGRQTRPSVPALARALADGGKLPQVTMVSDNRLSAFELGQKVPPAWASFDQPVQLPDGRWKLSGKGGFSDKSVADLVLITAESGDGAEQIIAFAAPLLADTFWERQSQRRLYPEHFLGWSRTISIEELPKRPLTFRAYVFNYQRKLVRPVDGAHRIE